MARKPLIDPNSLNQGGSTPQSTISRIVQRDRETSGRANPPETPPAPETEITSEPVSQLTGEPAHQTTGTPVVEPTREPATRSETQAVVTPEPVRATEPESPTKARAKRPEPSPKSEGRRQAAEERVEQMGKSPMKQIGPRIPGEWDEWLEDYVYARRKTGLQKQDIIRDLVRQFIVSEIAREEGEA